MKRLHVHIGVQDLDKSIQFYNQLFGESPIKTKDDYAKWELDDPRVNFAISTRSHKTGVDHLGLQVEEEQELTEIRERLNAADMTLFDEGQTDCCYARSDKSWVADPSGVAWEAFRTMEDVPVYNRTEAAENTSCCVPG